MKRTVILAAGAALVLMLTMPNNALAGYPEDCAPWQTQHTLTAGDDVASFNDNPQCVDALGGYDFVYTGGGDDRIYGDGGGDYLYGEGGRDYLFGGAGDDTLTGGTGADYLVGNSSTYGDVFYDGPNPSGSGDTIIGSSALNDILYHCTGSGSNSGADVIDPSIETVINGSSNC